MKITILLASLIFSVCALAQESQLPDAPNPQIPSDQSVSQSGQTGENNSSLPDAPSASKERRLSIHVQSTIVEQAHENFRSPYQGANSLPGSAENAMSFTSTVFFGFRISKNTEIYFNPEISAGSGLGSTHGVAGFPNGEIYRVETPSLRENIPARLYVVQTIPLGKETEHIEDGPNQIEGDKSIQRITIIVGKFSLNDFFDNNSYSHDPRSQFLNWALMDNGAWDYAADSKGYTWGVYGELNQKTWAVRVATVMVPSTANGPAFDTNVVKGHGSNAEFEYRYKLGEHPGKVRILGYMNDGLMRRYTDMINQLKMGQQPATNTTQYNSKYGTGINAEQEVTKNLGVFARAGWNDGKAESWAFTEIDRSFSAGAAYKGTRWHRPNDTAGVAGMVNGLSAQHREFLQAGGYGFIIGDGKLVYGKEQIVEAYYSAKVLHWLSVGPDFQYVKNPGYNTQRGPVPIFAGRLHFEWGH